MARWGALIGVSAVAACCASLSTTIPAHPIQRLYHESGRPLCTTFAVREGWITAYHCTQMGPVTVGGLPTPLVRAGPAADLALFAVDHPTQPFRVAHVDPPLGAAVTVTGFVPQSGNLPIIFFGHISSLSTVLPNVVTGTDAVMLLHEGGGPGTSGAPVMYDGRVVGVVRAGFETPSVMVLAVPTATLRAFLRQ